MGKCRKNKETVIAVSGGPDSVYLAHEAGRSKEKSVIAHFNHRARGRESDEDQAFVKELANSLGIPVEIGRSGGGEAGERRVAAPGKGGPRGFEGRARAARYAFLGAVAKRRGGGKLLLGHTADDQVETILMRFFEGSGISGLKGIPRRSATGIERPLLGVWREEIMKYLEARKIPFRTDRSNKDTRHERNWIRHVLLPLLEERYGKQVRKRIHAVGERFREIDEFLEESARTLLKRHSFDLPYRSRSSSGLRDVSVNRGPYSRKPAALRKKALQLICFERLGISPNERLLESVDRLITSGKPSGRVCAGNGWEVFLRYDEAIFRRERGTRSEIGRRGDEALPMTGPGAYPVGGGGGRAADAIRWEERRRLAASAIRRLAVQERCAAFDADALRTPLFIRPLRAGDRITPFGLHGSKKVKEIMIERRVPMEERWGRPVVCDRNGEILWIPGVVRSSSVPVSGGGRVALLRFESSPE